LTEAAIPAAIPGSSIRLVMLLFSLWHRRICGGK
jgi:hypothetical protein